MSNIGTIQHSSPSLRNLNHLKGSSNLSRNGSPLRSASPRPISRSTSPGRGSLSCTALPKISTREASFSGSPTTLFRSRASSPSGRQQSFLNRPHSYNSGSSTILSQFGQLSQLRYRSQIDLTASESGTEKEAVDVEEGLIVTTCISDDSYDFPINSTTDATTASPSLSQKRTLKMLARGGNTANRVAQIVQNPLNGLTGLVADAGSEMFMSHLAHHQHSSDSPSDKHAPNPVATKVLSLALSTLMSGATSGAVVDLNPMNLFSPGSGSTGSELSVQMNNQQSAQDLASRVAMRVGPSLMHAPTIKASETDELFGAGSIAASAVMKLAMRAGSSGPALGDILDGVLGSVDASIDDTSSNTKS